MFTCSSVTFLFPSSEVVEWMLNDHVPVSLAVEQSLPVLYAADQTALLAVIDRTRKAGHKPSRCVSKTLTFRNMDPDGCKRNKKKMMACNTLPLKEATKQGEIPLSMLSPIQLMNCRI